MMAPEEIIALIALGVSVLFSVLSSTRSSAEDVRKQIEDAKKEAAEKATIQSSLASIKSDTEGTRSELRSMRGDIGEIGKRLLVVEQSTKSAHHRIDRIDEVLDLRKEDDSSDKLEGSGKE